MEISASKNGDPQKRAAILQYTNQKDYSLDQSILVMRT